MIHWFGCETKTRDKSCSCMLSNMGEMKMTKSKADLRACKRNKNLEALITLKLNFTTNPTLLSMGWVNLYPEASIMPDIYQITCCAYNGSWNDESLINMQTYQVGFDRVSAVRKAKNIYFLLSLFYFNIEWGSKMTLNEKYRALGAPWITVQGPI